MLKVSLYRYTSEAINVTIDAYFDEKDNLVIDGFDIGQIVEELMGDFDYEYSLTIPPGEVTKLYVLFGLTPGSREELLAHFQAHYNSDTCFSEIRELLTKNVIKFEAFSWR